MSLAIGLGDLDGWINISPSIAGLRFRNVGIGRRAGGYVNFGAEVGDGWESFEQPSSRAKTDIPYTERRDFVCFMGRTIGSH